MQNLVEEKIKEELRLWIKRQYRSWRVYPHTVKTLTFNKGGSRQVYHFSPDIDVSAFCKAEGKLIGFEVKAPRYRCDSIYIYFDKKGDMYGWDRYKNLAIKNLEDIVKTKKKGIKIEPDLQIIYTSIGQALYYLRYVDLSFVVLPNLEKFCPDRTHSIFLDLLLKKFLPLGLIEYPFDFKYPFPPSSDSGPKISKNKLKTQGFKEILKGQSLLIWKDYNTYTGYAENYIWKNGLPEATFRNCLIQRIMERNISRNKI